MGGKKKTDETVKEMTRVEVAAQGITAEEIRAMFQADKIDSKKVAAVIIKVEEGRIKRIATTVNGEKIEF